MEEKGQITNYDHMLCRGRDDCIANMSSQIVVVLLILGSCNIAELGQPIVMEYLFGFNKKELGKD